jgi:hypothetical protein
MTYQDVIAQTRRRWGLSGRDGADDGTIGDRDGGSVGMIPVMMRQPGKNEAKHARKKMWRENQNQEHRLDATESIGIRRT